MKLALAALCLAACAAPGTEPRAELAPPEAAPDWPAIAAELARRVEVDQELRRALVESEPISLELVESLERADADNTAWMKVLVERHGWPTIASVGAEGEGHAWLLVQHADHDVDFQERCLALLQAAAAAGQAGRQHVAYLEDRVALHRGRPQRYGTQFVTRDGRLEPYELEDPARVDEWRAAIGLGTLAEYAELLRSQ